MDWIDSVQISFRPSVDPDGMILIRYDLLIPYVMILYIKYQTQKDFIRTQAYETTRQNCEIAFFF